MKKLIITLSFIFSIFSGVACQTQEPFADEQPTNESTPTQEDSRAQFSKGDLTVYQEESYFSHEKVALYLYAFDELPPNYLRKQEADDLGWIPSEGNLWDVTDQGMIGGDYFGNREGLLPDESGRSYFSADVNYNPEENAGRRGAERLVYSNDGLIFYTDDHYDSYEQLYGN